ncbi:MAG: hypothetical protein KKE20_04705 [Nanoarchaeota archaeon]|nr:hypothetical protein [Nanoarchaeota archaeon]
MEYGFEYLERKVDAFIVRTPQDMPIILLDVYQKEGDCVRGYSLEERMGCEKDCQNTFFSAWLNVLGDLEIIGMGMLVRNAPAVIAENMEKVGMTKESFVHLLETSPGTFGYEDDEGSKTILYNTLPIATIDECGFNTAEYITTTDPEFVPYIKMVQEEPKEVLRKCGIEVMGNVILNHRKNKQMVELMKTPKWKM